MICRYTAVGDCAICDFDWGLPTAVPKPNNCTIRLKMLLKGSFSSSHDKARTEWFALNRHFGSVSDDLLVVFNGVTGICFRLHSLQPFGFNASSSWRCRLLHLTGHGLTRAPPDPQPACCVQPFASPHLKPPCFETAWQIRFCLALQLSRRSVSLRMHPFHCQRMRFKEVKQLFVFWVDAPHLFDLFKGIFGLEQIILLSSY